MTAVEGVEDVKIDFATKIATCTVVLDKFDTQAALESVQAIDGDGTYSTTTIVN